MAIRFCPLLPLFFAVGNLKNVTDRKYTTPIVALSIIASIINIYASYQSKAGINNMPSLHLLTVLEFLCVSLFYYVVVDNRNLKKVIIYLAIAFISFSAINSSLIQGIYQYNSYSRGLEAFLIICYSLVMFYQMLRNIKDEKLEHNSLFWFNTAFLLYFSSTQFLFLFHNLILTTYSKEVARIFWDVHAVVCILYYLLLGIGLWKVRSKQTLPTSLS